MAPEVLNRRVPFGDGGKAADVYFFATVAFEVSPPRLCSHTKPLPSPLIQILAGIIPFPKEIMGRVATGLRPEWPADNPCEGLLDMIWKPFEPCWNQLPGERPTVLEVQRALQLAEDMSLAGCCDSPFPLDPTPY